MSSASTPEGSTRCPPPEEPLAGNYFVAAYPPFSVWSRTHLPAFTQVLEQAPAHDARLGFYVHLPFCQHKCDYCYYLSYIHQKPEVINHYLETLVREYKLYAAHPAVAGREVSFAYFGGGTPSLLTPAQVRFLGDNLKGLLDWSKVREITYELAPRSVRPNLLKALVEIGVNRFSMGVQSFDNSLLKMNGRVHMVEDVERAYQMMRQHGIDWINLDLMVGLVGETGKLWVESVKRMIELEPESVTIYQTEIPYNTTLYHDMKSGKLAGEVVPWSVKRRRLAMAFQMLEAAGYTIVSGYAAVKDPVRHRFHYQHDLWHGADMLGLGVASFGYLGGTHVQNAASLPEYQAKVEGGELPVTRAYALEASDRLVREFIMQLKLGRVEVSPFREKFGLNIRDVFAQPLDNLEKREFLRCDDSGIALTRRGLLQVDRLLPEFYDSRYANLRYS